MKVLLLFIALLISVSLSAQVIVYDDFSKKDLSSWIWGGIDMKYSHETDNKENGYVEIFSTQKIKPNSYIGKTTKTSPILFSVGNYVNVMMQGVNNDAFVRIELLYDIDNNGKYNEDKDILLMSKPVSLNFSGWKEIKVKLDEENFKLISKFNDDFTVTEESAIALQFEFESGKNYKEGKFLSGIALISEIPNKENIAPKENDTNLSTEKESYFEAKNYPNPFNPSTTISFTLKEGTNVKLTVYDRLGREVKTLLDENKPAGTYTIDFNASGLPSGIYFYRIKTDAKTEVRKMIFAK